MKLNDMPAGRLILPVVIALALPCGAVADDAGDSQKELKKIVIEAREVANEWVERVREWKGGEARSTTYIGVVIEAVPDVLRDYVDLPKGVGLLLPSIAKDGPADKAGLMDNDILVKFDGQWIINFSQLSTLIDMKGPGATVPVTIMRKGEEMTFEVTLEERMRKGNQFLLPDVPDVPDAPEVPMPDDVGIYMQKIDEWIPGSVRVFIDENEKVHVDLDELKENLGQLQGRLRGMHVMKDMDPEIILQHGDMGARTTQVRVADRNVNFSSDQGRVVLSSSSAGKHVMVWDSDDQLLYEGPLPENYQTELPPEAARLIQSLDNLDLKVKDNTIEVELNAEASAPVTLLTRRS